MSIYKDFVGINICVYDPCGTDYGSENEGTNILGYTGSNIAALYSASPATNKNIYAINANRGSHLLAILNAHRNGVGGYSSWAQTRTSHNHLTRDQIRNNVFTYVLSPGARYSGRYSNDNKLYSQVNRFSSIKREIEPCVSDACQPLVLMGGMRSYNALTNMHDVLGVEIKSSVDNEMLYFANERVDRDFNIFHGDEPNYDELKNLYLNDAINDNASPIEQFNILNYSRYVWPQVKDSFLERTRSRIYFRYGPWASTRTERRKVSATSFDVVKPRESSWPLDTLGLFGANSAPVEKVKINASIAVQVGAVVDHRIGGAGGTMAQDPSTGGNIGFVGGWNTGESTNGLGFIGTIGYGGSGILQNTYAQLGRGYYASAPDVNLSSAASAQNSMTPVWAHRAAETVTAEAFQRISASCYYSRIHTIQNPLSQISPNGLWIEEDQLADYYLQQNGLGGNKYPYNSFTGYPTGSNFGGATFWDAPRQSKKFPFYGSYESFGDEVRLKGKSYSIIPEFRISSHVRFYSENPPTLAPSNIFEISGAIDKRSDTRDKDFYSILSTSDFLKNFELIKSDHQDFVNPSIITLKCKALMKFLPYDGFYPAERTVELSKQFYDSYSDGFSFASATGSVTASANIAKQALLEPLFAPGVLFNTIKSGVACDWPTIHVEDNIRTGSFDVFGDNCLNSEYYPDYGWAKNHPNPTTRSRLIQAITGSNLAGYHTGSKSTSIIPYRSIFSQRVPFEALADPAEYLANRNFQVIEPHPWGASNAGLTHLQAIGGHWDGTGDKLYEKMANNFLASSIDFFLKDGELSSISSLESSNPNFGNVEKDKFYGMRIKMRKSLRKPTPASAQFILGYSSYAPGQQGSVYTPQKYSFLGSRESITMYSRPSAFGPAVWGGNVYQNSDNITPTVMLNGRNTSVSNNDSMWGNNYCYTPPYYYGEAWCDILFQADKTGKMSVDEIISKSQEFPYYTRFWRGSINDAFRDLIGFDRVKGALGGTFVGPYVDYWKDGPWYKLFYNYKHNQEWQQSLFPGNPGTGSIYGPATNTFRDGDPSATQPQSWWMWPWMTPGTGSLAVTILPPAELYGPQHPSVINFNAMQINSSLNLWGRGIFQKNSLSDTTSEVQNADTVQSKSRWIIQTKFETPILNFNKYGSLKNSNCTIPTYASGSVSRGMWHQYGEKLKGNEGIYMQVQDLPHDWLMNALYYNKEQANHVGSLADLCGFSKEPVKLGMARTVKEISEVVVAVPFVEKDERRFFTIPKRDIDDAKSLLSREISPGVYTEGSDPKVGNSVVHMVKMMKNYVFPPPMDFVKYPEIQPFVMYAFEFKYNLEERDVTDIWQNLLPDIGRKMVESEATISHELLAKELLGAGSVINNGILDENAVGPPLPSDIRWMLFKVKKRSPNLYKDKVVKFTGIKSNLSETIYDQEQRAELSAKGIDPGITYNWPYDFFSLVELAKLEASVGFANIENDDKGNKFISPIIKEDSEQRQNSEQLANDISTATGRKRE